MNYYIVGGYVRDELLGVKSKDIDYAVEAESYEAMREDIISKGMIIFQERPEYLSIRARHPDSGPADFTLCRTDGFYSDSRRPDTVHIGNIYDDLARRDFTVNAIAKDEFGVLIDPHGGVTDLRDMRLRCVGNTEERFREDPLRILRAIRFHIVRGFTLTNSIRNALNSWSMASLLETLPAERMYDELKKCFEYNTWMTIDFLDNYPLIKTAVFAEKLSLLPVVNYGAVVELADTPLSKSGS